VIKRMTTTTLLIRDVALVLLAALIFLCLRRSQEGEDEEEVAAARPAISAETAAAAASIRMVSARVECFAAAMPLWLALFLRMTAEKRKGPILLCAGLVVLYCMHMEVHGLRGSVGELEDSEGGENELPGERSTRIAAMAFALGTLLISQKNGNLHKEASPLVFLGLFFAIIPSLATGVAARRRARSDPYFAAVQRILLCMGGGLLCVCLAWCVQETGCTPPPLLFL